MDLMKMYEAQMELEKVGLFDYDGPDRFQKTVLGLIVEIAECANEWRGFKYWSTNQAPRVKAFRGPFIDPEDGEEYNPLLEEYADGFHFVLKLAIGSCFYATYEPNHHYKEKTIEEQFLTVMDFAIGMYESDYIHELFHSYIHLGHMLGFTDQEIEKAYFEKNKENLARQARGY